MNCPEPALCRAGDACAGRCRPEQAAACSAAVHDGDRPTTPTELSVNGYRIERGSLFDGGLAGRYWWTWSRGSAVVSSDGDWGTPDEAIADARRDLAIA